MLLSRASALANKQAKTVLTSLLRERAMVWLALEKPELAIADIDVCLVQAATLLPVAQLNPTLAGCQWRAAQIEFARGNTSSAQGFVTKALAGYRVSDANAVSLAFEQAQARIVQMQLAQAQGQISAAQDAGAQAKTLLQPWQEYWLARQLLTRLN